MEELLFIGFLSSYVPLAHTAQAHLARDGTTHRGLGPPALIICQENVRHVHRSTRGDSSTEVLFSYVCQVVHKINQDKEEPQDSKSCF